MVQLTKTQQREKLAIWVDNEDIAKLRALQNKYGVTVSELIRWYVKEGLQHERHPVQK